CRAFGFATRLAIQSSGVTFTSKEHRSVSQSSPPSAESTRPATSNAAAGGPPIQRQMVNFAFYKLDPAFRRLEDSEKRLARDEFVRIVDERREGLMCLS